MWETSELPRTPEGSDTTLLLSSDTTRTDEKMVTSAPCSAKACGDMRKGQETGRGQGEA